MQRNGAYQMGYWAGRSRARLVPLPNGNKTIEYMANPFPWWRCISWALWEDGHHNGLYDKLTERYSMTKKSPPDNTAMAIIIVVIVFAFIVAFFAAHEGNTPEDNEFNRIVDTLR